jgi:hypothetical protein
MAMDFKLLSTYASGEPMKKLEKASSTVIEAGDMVALDAGGLAIKATAASTAIAWTRSGAAAGELYVQVLDDHKAEFAGSGDANFAKTQRGTVVDLVVNSNHQQIDVGTSVTDVFKISAAEDAGVVGSPVGIKVRINKFLY